MRSLSYKIIFRDDTFVFGDMLLIGEAKEMLVNGNYNLFIDLKVIVAIMYWLLSCGIICVATSGGIRRSRAVVFVVSVMVGAIICPIYGNDDFYDSIGVDTFWLPTEHTITRGGLYPFLHSIYTELERPPENYDEDAVRHVLSEYEDSDIPKDRMVNIISIMREAYVDFSKFQIKGLDCSGYAVYHKLKEESYSGELVTNIFAGGTVNTERCFLTGDYKLKKYTRNTNSYVWYLRQQGYTVEGSHPFMQSMYNRKNVNNYLGFERYRYLENDFELLSKFPYPEDSVLLSEIYNDYKKHEPGKSYFSFNINVQSHGPYLTDSYREDVKIKEYLTGNYTDECKFAMNNYMSVIIEQDMELEKLINKLSDEQEPVVVIVFSDHLPWMGNANAFYNEMGIEFRTNTEEGFRDYYSTEYFIWANGKAKEVLENDFVGRGPTISPCYLMNVVFEQCGWNGPSYMQAMDHMKEIFPVFTINGGYIIDDRFTYEIPENRKQDMLNLESLAYYWRNVFWSGK